MKTQALCAGVASALMACALIGCGDRNPEDPYSSTGSSRNELLGRTEQSGSQIASVPGNRGAGAAAADRSQQFAPTAHGELTSVDIKSQMLSVRTESGPVIFRYDDRTTITGSETGRAGLAATKGSQVVVQYRNDGTEKVATMIDLRSGSQRSFGHDDVPGTSNAPGQHESAPPDRSQQNR